MARRVGWLILTTVLFGAGQPARRSRRRPTTRRRTTRPASAWVARCSPTTPIRSRPMRSTPTATASTPMPSTSRRAYLNVTGQLNHLFAFRITPDVVRETGSRQLAERAHDVRPEIRLRAAQPRRLAVARELRSGGYDPDALCRLRGEHLPLSLPGHGVRRPRRISPLVGLRDRVSNAVSQRATAKSSAASTTAKASRGSRPTIRRPCRCAARSVRSPTPMPHAACV